MGDDSLQGDVITRLLHIERSWTTDHARVKDSQDRYIAKLERRIQDHDAAAAKMVVVLESYQQRELVIVEARRAAASAVAEHEARQEQVEMEDRKAREARWAKYAGPGGLITIVVLALLTMANAFVERWTGIQPQQVIMAPAPELAPPHPSGEFPQP